MTITLDIPDEIERDILSMDNALLNRIFGNRLAPLREVGGEDCHAHRCGHVLQREERPSVTVVRSRNRSHSQQL